MTNTRTMSSTGSRSNITHQLLSARPTATVIDANATYIGLRVKRYGPEMTRVVAGRIGTIDVRERRKLRMLTTASVRPATANAHAKRLTPPSPTGNGHFRFRP